MKVVIAFSHLFRCWHSAISDFKQNTVEDTDTATVTKENWYVHERSSNSKMRSCMQNGINRLAVKSLSKSFI